MIKKIYRLNEREVKKVLGKGKPFFSYGIVINSIPNKLPYNRYAIVIGSKSVKTNVERNYFRRYFYKTIEKDILKTQNLKLKTYQDKVFVVKKKTKLDKNNIESINSFKQNINFLIKKVKGKKY